MQHRSIAGMARLLTALGVLFATTVAARAAVPYTWGDNWYGQLGDGTYEASNFPGQAYGLVGANRIDAGAFHTLAVATDGKAWAWGWNGLGQLGDGTYDDRNTPTQVPGLTNVVAVSAGYYHSLAVRSDGTVWAWGDNAYGQIGDGTTTIRPSPVQVSGLTNVIAVAAGSVHSLAVRSDGTVWAWGYNGAGQLGDGTDTTRLTPVQVSGLTDIDAVAAGNAHSLALQDGGAVHAWGDNYHGQLGDGTTTRRYEPVPVSGISGALSIAAGANHSLAVESNGTAVAWGNNAYGQLGDGTTDERWTPVAVIGLTEVTQLAGGDTHSAARRADGSAWAWGDNSYGQLGDGTNIPSLEPIATATITTAEAVTAGAWHGAALVPTPEPTKLVVTDRTATITETVGLRAYLARLADNVPLPNRAVAFKVDGTSVGSGTTNDQGRADVNWVVTSGPAQRTIQADFAGDVDYQPTTGTGTLTCQSWVTKMAPFSRTARITDRTELKVRLVRSDDVPVYGMSINFYIDGTFVIARTTDIQGYARHPSYDVPDGAGAGVRTITYEWTGNGGYLPVTRTGTLTALKAIPYIWVLSKSVPQGAIANLYAYFRRLYDYKKQEGKTVSFKIDGTWIADVVSGTGVEAGVARHLHPTAGLAVGGHTVRCEFAGDAWVDAGFGEGTLTIL